MKRLKRRYLALSLDAISAPSEREFVDGVWATITRLFGEYGASLANLVLIDYNSEHKSAVIRVNLVALEIARTALAAITSIGGKEAAVHVQTISGTLKALRQKTSAEQSAKRL